MSLPYGALTWYEPTWRGRPPAMPRADYPIWLAFLDEYATQFNAFAYDVLLPHHLTPPPTLDADGIELWRRLTARRIDAVARRGELYDLIEVRPRASMQTLGQIITYRDLWPRTYPTLPLGAAAIVCASCDQDLLRVAAAQHLRVYDLAIPAAP